MNRHAPKKMTREQLRSQFLQWLHGCRDNALDWPAEELARAYGMKIDEVCAAVAGERDRRGIPQTGGFDG